MTPNAIRNLDMGKRKIPKCSLKIKRLNIRKLITDDTTVEKKRGKKKMASVNKGKKKKNH